MNICVYNASRSLTENYNTVCVRFNVISARPDVLLMQIIRYVVHKSTDYKLCDEKQWTWYNIILRYNNHWSLSVFDVNYHLSWYVKHFNWTGQRIAVKRINIMLRTMRLCWKYNYCLVRIISQYAHCSSSV